ncbi:hypothetical protein JOB18_038910 [Solea senegalensis]|uniref:Uncharacterized protein n=1 Tax=Solea senegalensis TaxID=28829 RepID=A0AAV6SM56_SOLSE|nr:hypothetical protein JOB18_038910 [Solea senegalensis]
MASRLHESSRPAAQTAESWVKSMISVPAQEMESFKRLSAARLHCTEDTSEDRSEDTCEDRSVCCSAGQ